VGIQSIDNSVVPIASGGREGDSETSEVSDSAGSKRGGAGENGLGDETYDKKM